MSFPPPNYIPTESAVDGIQVYKPAPVQEEHRQIVRFVCPQCGGTQAYSVEAGGLTCTNCGYYEPPQAQVVGPSADSFEFTAEIMERVAHGWGDKRKDLVCQSCGAHTTAPPHTLTYVCPFCGSVKVIQREAPQDALRPRYLVPFSLKADDCRAVMREWLGASFLAPKALRQLAQSAQFTAIYLPFWTFSAHARAKWQAEVQKKRKIAGKTHYYWKWESGRVRHTFDNLIVSGTSQVSTRFLDAIQPFHLKDMVAYDPKFLAGLQAQAYEIDLDTAWGRARRQMREQMRRQCREHISTGKIRNFSMDLSYKKEQWRYILLPVYLAAYSFNRRPYQVVINGQTGKIAGQRPADWRKIAFIALAVLLPTLLLAILPQWLFPTLPAANTVMSIGLFTFVLALLSVVIMIVAALRLDDD